MPTINRPTRAVVVGGTRGIGRAITRDLLESGAQVAVVGRDEAAGRETVGDRGAGLVLSADVTDDRALAEAFARISEQYGGLDVAVNTVGALPPPGLVTTLDSQALLAAFDVNVVGIHRAMRHEIALMSDGGSIVNVSSIVGPHLTLPGMAAYGATKAALSNLTRAAAREHARDGIRINAVSPGPVDTAMSYLPGEDQPARDARLADQHPLGRVASLDEIVAAVRYLTSGVAGSTIGADLVVDGAGSV